MIAVSSDGEIFTSPDGANWMSDTSGTTLDLNKVSQCGDKYIAVGDNGAIILGTESALSGDLNSDKSVDVLDLALLREYLLKPDIEINSQLADINSDGVIDSMDYLLLKSIIIQN